MIPADYILTSYERGVLDSALKAFGVTSPEALLIVLEENKRLSDVVHYQTDHIEDLEYQLEEANGAKTNEE